VTRALFKDLPNHWCSKPLKHACSLNPEVLPENTNADTELLYVDIAALDGGDEESHKKQIVVAGGPIDKTMRVSGSGTASVQNNLCGYIVVSAESHEAAAKLFENHPHFSIFPGEAVEVMECLPVPGA
jgi:hypothetical protein